MVFDEQEVNVSEEDDARLARILKEIANEVQEGIEMEAEFPSNNESDKMAILDMNVWMDSSSYIVYQHYQKQVASKQIMSAQSAQSAACKRSVHVQEVVRRILSTSRRLSWEESVAPVLSQYMKQMQTAGYDQKYKKNTLVNALRIFDKMVLEDSQGVRPLHRPKKWQEKERSDSKRKKKNSWSTKGGCIAPIFVPATPNGELAKEMKALADVEAIPGMKFKIIESGGRTVKQEVQRSNPTATPGCDHGDCLACVDGRGKGGNCQKSNVQYEMECLLCPPGEGAAYIGETSRNLYTRGKEHLQKYQSLKRNKDSFMMKHQDEKHAGREAMFRAKVTGTFRDCLSRQVSEGVYIRRSDKQVLNSKSEWHQPALWRVQSELLRE